MSRSLPLFLFSCPWQQQFLRAHLVFCSVLTPFSIHPISLSLLPCSRSLSFFFLLYVSVWSCATNWKRSHPFHRDTPHPPGFYRTEKLIENVAHISLSNICFYRHRSHCTAWLTYINSSGETLLRSKSKHQLWATFFKPLEWHKWWLWESVPVTLLAEQPPCLMLSAISQPPSFSTSIVRNFPSL